MYDVCMLSLVCLVVQEAVEYDSMVVVMVRECRGRWLVCRWQSSSSSSSLVVVVVATKLRSCQRNYEAANFVRFFTLTATDCDRLRPTATDCESVSFGMLPAAAVG